MTPCAVERRDDWRERLATLLDERRRYGFAFGRFDCCLWAADAVEAMTGVDFIADYRGYATPEGAMRRLKRAGVASVFAFVDARFPRAMRARQGDLVGVPAAPLDALMIADGPASAWGQDETGLVRLAIPPGAIIWSV